MSSVSKVQQLPELPPTWRWSTMDQACLKIQDGTHFSPKNQHSHGKYRYITAKNVKPSGLDLSDVSYLSEADHRVIYKRCDPQKDDVLLVKDGVNTGDAALNTLNEEFSLLSSVCLLRPRSDLISSPFLRYFILSPVGYRLLTGQMTGTAIKRIVLRRIKDSPVPIAPLSEQQRIVAEIEKQFSRLDEAVALLKRTKANLKRYKAAVLKAAVEGKLTEDWRKQHLDVEPASKLLERILAERRAKWGGRGKYKESRKPDIDELPALPEKWAWATVDQLTSTVTSGSRGWGDYYSDTGPLFIRAQDIKTDSLNIENVARVRIPANAEGTRTAVANGDVLVTITGANVTKSALIRSLSEQAFVSQHVALLKPCLAGVSPYLFTWVVSPAYGRRTLERWAYGAGKPGLSLDQVRSLPVAVPSLAEQDQIVSEVDRRLSVIDELDATVQANLTRADCLRQSILSQAFSGRLLRAGAPNSRNVVQDLPVATEPISPDGAI